MESFEARIARATDPKSREVLGMLALIVNGEGRELYRHAAGYKSLAPDAPIIDADSCVFMGSAGKIITHIAALQFVEQGILSLDEPVYAYLPELQKLDVISRSPDDGAAGFTLRSSSNPITLRHLLLHTSGISDGEDPLTEAWRAAQTSPQEFPEGTHPIVSAFSTPLLFDAGEDWHYGHSIHWLQLLVTRVGPSGPSLDAKTRVFLDHIKNNIFDRLGMNSSTYNFVGRDDVKERMPQVVERQKEDATLIPAPEGSVGGLASSISDIGRLLSDLVAPESKLLSRQSLDLLFAAGLQPGSKARDTIQYDTSCYAATIGTPYKQKPMPVNWTCGAALLMEKSVANSPFPAGWITWNGLPNIIWAMNRERGVGMLVGTQLLPVDDQRTVDLMMEFFRCAFTQHG